MSGILTEAGNKAPATFIGGASRDLVTTLPVYHRHTYLLRHPTGCTNDRFEGPPEARSRISIFPLSDSVGGQLWPAGHCDNEGRLGPPELTRTGQTRSWRIWSRKDPILRSERNGRLLHGNFCQKMRSECTIFPYAQKCAFLEKSTLPARQFRRPHSSLRAGSDQKVSFVTKVSFLDTFSRSDEWAGLKGHPETRENTRKHQKTRENSIRTPH